MESNTNTVQVYWPCVSYGGAYWDLRYSQTLPDRKGQVDGEARIRNGIKTSPRQRGTGDKRCEG